MLCVGGDLHSSLLWILLRGIWMHFFLYEQPYYDRKGDLDRARYATHDNELLCGRRRTHKAQLCRRKLLRWICVRSPSFFRGILLVNMNERCGRSWMVTAMVNKCLTYQNGKNACLWFLFHKNLLFMGKTANLPCVVKESDPWAYAVYFCSNLHSLSHWLCSSRIILIRCLAPGLASSVIRRNEPT